MKKILIVLITILYISVSFICIKLFSENQLYKILSNNSYKITISNWKHDSNVKNLFSKIEEFSNENNINIYRINFDGSTYNHRDIHVYASVGNITNFKSKFNIQKNFFIDKDNFNLSTNQIRKNYIKLFNKKIYMEIKSLSEANNIPVDGIYYITTNNKLQLEKTLNYFNNIGLDISRVSYINNVKANIMTEANTNLIEIIIILDLAIILSLIYYIISKFKEFGVKKLFGYSTKKIILKSCFLDVCFICLKSAICSFIIILIYLLCYNGLTDFLYYLYYWIIGVVIITIFLVLTSIPSYFLVYTINIVETIKNKKPTTILEFLSYISKIIFSVILMIIFINIYNGYTVLKEENNNNGWKYAKNYSYLEYDVSYMAKPGGNRYYNETQISKKFFQYLNNNGGILIAPSVGLSMKNEENNNLGIGINPNTGNVVYVNNNYLNINPIYDINNRKVSFNNFNSGNKVEILIPEMYRDDIIPLLSEYTKYVTNRKYINKNFYYRSIGKKQEKERKTNVIVTFIKNNQKTFLYEPNSNIKDNNYSQNSIIVVINSNDYGGDSYLSYLTEGYIMPYIGKGYQKLNNEIKSLGLSKYILNEPSVYSRLSNYISQVDNKINSDLYLLMAIVIVELILAVFMMLNYLEKDKYKNTIKYIYGYSFLKIYKEYVIILLMLWSIITLIGVILYSKRYNIILTVSSICFIIEFIISIIITKLYSVKKSKNILKGE